MKSSNLTENSVEHLAKLSNITLTSNEVNKFKKQLRSILEHVDELQKVNTDSVDATAQVTGLENVYFEDGEENKQEKIELKKEGDHFVVKRII